MAAAYLERMGERIRTRREELHLSRSDVARKLPGKTNENAVYRWEKGQHRPNDDTLEALAEALDTTVAYFLTEEPAGQSTPDLPGADQLSRIERKLDILLAHTAASDEQLADLLEAELQAADASQDDAPADSTSAGTRAAGGHR